MCSEGFDQSIRYGESKVASDSSSRLSQQLSHRSVERALDTSESRPCEIDICFSRTKSSPCESFLSLRPPWPFERSQSRDGHWRTELDEALLLLDALSIADCGRLRSIACEPEPRRALPRPPSGSLIISARAPHTILAASPGLCTLLGFSAAEMANRSVRLLYGPATDPAAIPSAVKRLFAHEACTTASVPALTIHDRSGAPHAVSAVCTHVPAPGGGAGVAGSACRLRLEWSSAPAERMAARGPPALPACLWSLL